jgi:hypothetical protein
MTTATKVRPGCTAPEPSSTHRPRTDAALTALLDHLAAELAREYVRLMEMAGKNEGVRDRQRHLEER